ncbi:Apolipoprotein(a) (Fragment) [Seminavis robusta]|uniref:Apolipoprotein(A) n=1 Tax=Seminavis robusta TaxID=568900 RepID=A0A9N8EAX7_9STRA
MVTPPGSWSTIWEYCDVPECGVEIEEKEEVQFECVNCTAFECGNYSISQSDYRGAINITESGRECQPWSSQFPHLHDFTPENYPGAGLDGNACRNPDPSGAAIQVNRAFCLTNDPDRRFEKCLVPACVHEGYIDYITETESGFEMNAQDVNSPWSFTCGTMALRQQDYRGNISWTAQGIPCQRWDSDEPHGHVNRPEERPGKGLGAHNYCRNPGADERAWCYTTSDTVRWAYCDVPACEHDGEEPSDPILQNTCGTMSMRQTDYTGKIAYTKNGFTCQRWDTQEPNTHRNTPETKPFGNLEENYCRNPDNEPDGAWCYVADPEGPRWEYCPVPSCPEEVVEVTYSESCGTHSLLQQDYIGDISQTISGLPCQRWDAQAPNAHQQTPENKPTAHLESNFCRNPDGEIGGAWCYNQNFPEGPRWEYCSVPKCENEKAEEEDEEAASASQTCGTLSIMQTDYAGDISTTENGYECQTWDSQSPNEHGNTPEDKPNAHLESNFCRNPDGEARAWCYVADPDGPRWEFCSIPSCVADEDDVQEEAPTSQTCGTLSLLQADYVGGISTTDNGNECQRWDSQSPNAHGNTPEDKPNAHLESNFCRNPDGEARAWCYVADPDGPRWEFCAIPLCAADEDDVQEEAPTSQTCGTLSLLQADYIGDISTTENGNECQRWDSQSPNTHGNTPEDKPNAHLESNFCRNPDGEARAWCYVADPDGPRWEFCAIPECPELHGTCGSRANFQVDYVGFENTTASGRPCVPWSDFAPPSESDEFQGAFCRNPTLAERAYCYVAEDADGDGANWEWCDIPFCEDLV